MSNDARAAQQSWNDFTSDKAIAALEFDNHWKAEKQRRKDALAEAIKACFAKNMSVPEVSALTGNSNNSFLYQLRAEYKAGKTREVAMIREEDLDIRFDWQYHDHKGVHGWLTDATREFIKVYGTPGTEWEGQYAIFEFVETDGVLMHKQIAGNTSFGNSISDREFQRRTQMLWQLLSGDYTKRIVAEDNPFKE